MSTTYIIIIVIIIIYIYIISNSKSVANDETNNKENFNFGFDIYIVGPPLQNFYKLTQEIQQIETRKSYKKKNVHIQIIRKFFGQIINPV